MDNKNIFSIKIGGQAGQGIKAAGLMFGKVATRSGFHIYAYTEYPSLIRGGHNVTQVCIAKEMVTTPIGKTDFLVALDQKTIDLHNDELKPGGGILFDVDKKYDLSKIEKGIMLYPVPLAKFAKEAGGAELLSNTAALGALLALFGGNLQILKDLLEESFGKKNPQIVISNHQAVESAYDFAKEQYKDNISSQLSPIKAEELDMIVSGNDAVALGAIAAGLQFVSIYPMSPTSNMIHVFAAFQGKYGFIYKQPEDEIAAVNMAIGAAYAGARAMTATSGGGFCLMTEAYGLAGMAEVPVVIVDGMRGGPATGLPTWTEQGDLRFALHAHQGDFPRIVLAAGDCEEAFRLTMQAFNLADKYQTPVMLLMDKNICENEQSVPFFDIAKFRIDRGKFSAEKIEGYERYALSADGISLRTIPGSGNFFEANSYTHSTVGFDSEESSDTIEQMDKRMQKLKTCEQEDMVSPILFGPENADVTIVSWGSNKGSIIHALKHYPNVNYLHITWMNPFPKEAVKKVLKKAKHILNIECNYTAQLGGLIKEKTGIESHDNLLKYDGRPIYPEEIAQKLDTILKK